MKSVKRLKDEKGIVLFESLVLVVVFITMISLMLGIYGAIHTSNLASIAARRQAFYYFNNRSNLMYFTDFGRPTAGSRCSGDASLKGQRSKHSRFHFVSKIEDSLSTSPGEAIPIGRTINFTDITPNKKRWKEASRVGGRVQFQGHLAKQVKDIWIKVGYGMCVGDLDCCFERNCPDI